MADKTVLREFLVALGYHIDQPSAKKFTDSLLAVSKGAAKAAEVILSVGVAAEAMVAKVSDKFEKLYYVSQRNKASISNIQALQFAFKQIGLSAEEGASGVESFGAALRTSPGLTAFIKNLGVVADGKDTIEVFLDTMEALSKKPYWQGERQAGLFGISEKEFANITNNLPQLRAAYAARKEMERKAGFDPKKAGDLALEYMRGLRALWEQVGLLGDAFAVKLIPYVKMFNDFILDGIQSFQEFIKLDFDTAFGEWAPDLRDIGVELSIIIDKIKELAKVIAESDPIKALKKELPEFLASLRQEGHAMLSFVDGVLALLHGDWGKAGAAFRKGIELDKNAGGKYNPAANLLKDVKSNAVASAPATPGSKRVLPNMAELQAAMPSLFGSPPAPQNTPLGMQQNNPGNMRDWDHGVTPIRRGFAVFNSMEQGLSALAGNILKYQERGWNSMREFFSHYAPPGENNTGAYISDVANRLGVDPDQKVNLGDQGTMTRLMAAIVNHEQGYQPFGAGAYSAAAASRGVVVNQETNIHVSGTDASATGRAVASEQGRVNSDIYRNYSTAPR